MPEPDRPAHSNGAMLGAAPWMALLLLMALAGCATGSIATTRLPDAGGPSSNGSVHGGTVVLYTCATENVEQALIAAFHHTRPGVRVEVFRAATGPLNAKIAADVRSGGVRADVIWACDPLTMHGYDQQKLLQPWAPPNAADIPVAYRSPRFVGIDLLYLVLAVHHGVPAPSSWSDLTGAGYRNAVGLPSPQFAASALGMLGYLASARGYGTDFYRELKSNGAVQVNSPTDTLAGVEQGRFKVGIALASAAYLDQRKGSPIDVIWPRPGAIAIYSPIGLTTKKNPSPFARQFADFAAGIQGQKAMAKANTYVILPGMDGPPIPAGAPVIAPDWPSLFDSSTNVLAEYSTIFGA
jgi:iron(III) transport system substrate-binding protein